MSAISQASMLVAMVLAIPPMLASPGFAQDCKPLHKFSTVQAGTLTVAPGTYPPYSSVDQNGELQGIDGDITKEIAKMECLKVKAIPSIRRRRCNT